MPQNQAAWIKAQGRALVVEDAPLNEPGPQEILIKNHAVAINPVDWKMQDHNIFNDTYPYIFGCDVAGGVEEIGSEVKAFAKGDRVIGNAVCLSKGVKYAAFQLYVLCPANVARKLPDHISFEQGCVLPLAINTAALGLFVPGHLGLPMPSVSPPTTDKAVLVYGGSTSVGATCIQLAKAAGVTVYATASKSNHEHCKTLGADEIFDYRDTDWVQQAAAAMKDKTVAGAYDSISTDDTAKATQEVVSAGSDSLVLMVSPPPGGVQGQFVFGANLTFDEDLAKAIWADFLGLALEKRALVPKPDPLVAGHGLDEIQKGMDLQKEGVSARKVVVTIA